MNHGLAFVALGLLSLIVACSSSDGSPAPPVATATPVPQIQPTPTTAQLSACLTNPAPATNNNQPAQFGYRVVSSPSANAPVQSPLNVQGQANPFEGAYGIAIFNAAGNQIASQNYNKSNLQLAFTAQLPFSVTSSTPACVWVFERSGNTGAPINVSQIPVTLLP